MNSGCCCIERILENLSAYSVLIIFGHNEFVSDLLSFIYLTGGDGHKPKRWIRHIFHKPIKHHLNLKHKKHDVLTLAAPPTVGSLLPSTSTMTLMPNGVPAAAGEYIHHLMHRHPLNIPVYHGGYHPVHVPEHFGPLGPFGHHWFYRHSPWQGYGYGVRYPFAHGFASGPWYGALPAHGFGYGYHHHFGHAPFRGGLLRHVLANYNYDLGHGYRRGFGYGHGYDHGDGELRIIKMNIVHYLYDKQISRSLFSWNASSHKVISVLFFCCK